MRSRSFISEITVGVIRDRVKSLLKSRARRSRKGSGPNPLRVDPTRSITLRRQFENELHRRFKRVLRDIYQLIVVEDAFGWKLNKSGSHIPVGNEEKFSTVMLSVREQAVLDEVRRLQDSLDGRDVLEMSSHAHITVMYGLHTCDPAEVMRIVGRTSPVWVTLGKLSLFQSEENDVLKYSVEGWQLHELNALLRRLPNTSHHPSYEPHMTVAYLRRGSGWKYLAETEIDGRRLVLQDMVFLDHSKNKSFFILNSNPITNTRWAFLSKPKQIEQFRKWLAKRMRDEIVDDGSPEAWWQKYINRGFQKGQERSYLDVRPQIKGRSDFYRGTKAEFLRQAFSNPVAREKVDLLASRVFTELEGVTQQGSMKLIRALTDGLTEGRSPLEIAEVIEEELGFSENRSRVIARTEIIRAHAEGQLEALRNLGVGEVSAAVEWRTAGDDRVCPLCEELEGIVLSLEEASGLLPRHPQCRCAWIPAMVGEEEDEDQIMTRGGITRAISASIKAEGWDTVKEGREGTKWIGADAKISRTRPRSILDDDDD